jgi:hypothetical protein
MIQIPLIPCLELRDRLRGMKGGRGRHGPGEGINLKCIEVFTRITQTRLSQAMIEGEISNRSHILLSQFFYRWDRGEISFYFNGKYWEVIFNNPPIQRNNMKRCVSITKDGAKLEKIYGVER